MISLKTFFLLIGAGVYYFFYCLKGLPEIVGRVRRFEKTANDPARWRYAIAPHYYHFPEALEFKTGLLAYIPDYMPHFFKGRSVFPDEYKNVAIGKRISRTAKKVLTNSRFTRSYLPQSALGVPEEKIISFNMPYLSAGAENGKKVSLSGAIVEKLTGKQFIFYPTQPNPNKRLDLLVQAWHLAQKELKNRDLFLVLTAIVIPKALSEEIRRFNLMDKLLVFPYINDSTLSWLYQQTVCLGFSSELEGNFPTQVLEALMNDCPIVCMEHPLIQSELREDSGLLLTAPFGDVKRFSELILHAMFRREEVLNQQGKLKEKILERFEFKTFAENVWKLDEMMAS